MTKKGPKKPPPAHRADVPGVFIAVSLFLSALYQAHLMKCAKCQDQKPNDIINPDMSVGFPSPQYETPAGYIGKDFCNKC